MAKPTSKQVNSYDEELAKFAQDFQTQEANTGGNFFGTKSGVLSFEGTAFPNNEVACIILDGIHENVLYESYDPDNPKPPLCFAFGRDEKTMMPHEEAQYKKATSCKECPFNQWGTGKKQDGTPSKGKACKNSRRLAIIPAGSFVNGQFQAITDPEHFKTATAGYLKLPTMSVANYTGFVKSVVQALNRPPFGVFVRIKSVPDPKSQFRITFEVLGQVPSNLLGIVMERFKTAQEEIAFPYQPAPEEDDVPVTTGKGAKTAAKKKAPKY
jgi:hypothetical protein